ncbi:hypothetical protein BDV93DRAFT_339722 [Ceratobasidium sp. AG-I]|nr:hypothetical protein BDV93DRAFT_339722 [Ceratobasidium sp. AG-I]
MKRYTDQHSFFDHYYGLLCLQLLVHVVNTGLLEFLGCLDDYQDGKVVEEELESYIFKAVFAATEEWNFANFFGGYDVLRQGSFLEPQGGLNILIVELLLWYLWNDRHTFLAINVHMGHRRQWATLFFVFVHFILAHRRGDFVGQILDLSHRYSLSATSFYDQTIAWLACCPMNHEPLSTLQSSLPVDQHDSVLITHLFVREIHPATNSTTNMIFCVLMPKIAAFGFSKIISETSFMAGYCAEAVSCRLISHLAAWPAEIFRTLTLMELSAHLFHFVAKSLESATFTGKSRFVGSLQSDSHFCDVAGRMLLMMSTLQAQQWKLSNRKVLGWLSTLARFFTKIITLLHKVPNIDSIFQTDYSTWVNTLCLALTRPYLFPAEDSIQGHFIQTVQIWLEFGGALGFSERLAQDSQLSCAYPRCATPEISGNILNCGACKNAVYCNAHCQNGHWTLQTADSHRLVCVGGSVRST